MLTAGGTCALSASGTARLGEVPAQEGTPATVIESEADGISLWWYRGRPAGRLLAAQWVEKPAGGGRPRFVVIGAGAKVTLAAVADGPLYLKVNESPGDLADNEGTLAVTITP